MTTDSEQLIGLDASNPLAFLAAIGTLRTATRIWPNNAIVLAWQVERGAWRPSLTLPAAVDADSFLSSLERQLKSMQEHAAFGLGDNLNVSPEEFREYAHEAVDAAHADGDRTWTDFVAAFGSEALTENGAVQDTAFRTMSGAGHQHFLASMRELIEATDKAHLERALFRPWDYRDDRPSLRWDPADDRRYAWRWDDPSSDPAKTMRGANRLAIEALPLFPTIPRPAQLETTGFTGTNSRNTFWRWPVWERPVTLETCRSLLALRELHERPLPRERLEARGVVEVFESQRITVGNFRNFTPARSVP